MSLPVIWVIVAIFFLVLEVSTAALISVWFIPSALITAVVAVFWDNPIAQIIIFIVLSAAFLFLFHKLYAGRRKHPEKELDTSSRLIGKSATATEDIDDENGKVLLGDVYWRAVTNGESIKSGETVKIISVDGTTLVVNKK